MYVKGLGGRKIADELTRQHRLNSSGIVKWETANIMRIIRNASYLGRVVYNKSYSNNYLDQHRMLILDEDKYIVGEKKFEAIVDDELFERANRLRKSKKKTTLVVNGQVIKRGQSRSADMWVNKLRCSCGSAFRRDLWHRDKNGVPSWGYRCYNKINYGNSKVRREAGISTEGFCEMKMIPQWRLEMIGEKIIQEIFIDRRGVIEEVIDLIKRCYRKDRKVISRNSDKDNLESIRYLENKLNNLIEMRAGGELTKEQYLEIKAKTEKELSEKRKLIITDSSDNTKLSIDKNLDRIEKALESVMDSNSEEMTDLLDKIVYMVNVVDERKFIFRLRYDKDRIGSISCETSGRKNFARINLSDTEGASEEVPDIHIIYIKKSCNMQKLCRLQSLTRSNSLKRTSITVM